MCTLTEYRERLPKSILGSIFHYRTLNRLLKWLHMNMVFRFQLLDGCFEKQPLSAITSTFFFALIFSIAKTTINNNSNLYYSIIIVPISSHPHKKATLLTHCLLLIWSIAAKKNFPSLAHYCDDGGSAASHPHPRIHDRSHLITSSLLLSTWLVGWSGTVVGCLPSWWPCLFGWPFASSSSSTSWHFTPLSPWSMRHAALFGLGVYRTDLRTIAPLPSSIDVGVFRTTSGYDDWRLIRKISSKIALRHRTKSRNATESINRFCVHYGFRFTRYTGCYVVIYYRNGRFAAARDEWWRSRVQMDPICSRWLPT